MAKHFDLAITHGHQFDPCIANQVVRASDGNFPGSAILRHYKALAWPSTVCGGYSAGSSGFCAGMRLESPGRKIPFPKCALVAAELEKRNLALLDDLGDFHVEGRLLHVLDLEVSRVFDPLPIPRAVAQDRLAFEIAGQVVEARNPD